MKTQAGPFKVEVKSKQRPVQNSAPSFNWGMSVNWHQCFFDVRDEQDEVVLEFPFLEAIEMEAGPS